jgi:hypothetical protein
MKKTELTRTIYLGGDKRFIYIQKIKYGYEIKYVDKATGDDYKIAHLIGGKLNILG